MKNAAFFVAAGLLFVGSALVARDVRVPTRASAQTQGDDPSGWPPDRKVETAIARLRDLKSAADRFAHQDCPATKAAFDSWLEEAVRVAAPVIGLQDATRQIRKTGAGAELLRAWDQARGEGPASSLRELQDLLARCEAQVRRNDRSFRPPDPDDLIYRAAQRINERKKAELAAIGITLEERDYFRVEGPSNR